MGNWQAMWAVLVIFLIPFGGGIPAGVILAQQKNISWPVMMILYFISDVILAFAFEPVMKLFSMLGRRFVFIGHLTNAMRMSVRKTTELYGNVKSPLALITIAFGVDPMTGRAAAAAAGHGFITGWAIAIAGDMMYFTVLMVSTLWLHSILGDGNKAMLIILLLMIFVPMLFRRLRRGHLGPTKNT